jgi:hypothetical protein
MRLLRRDYHAIQPFPDKRPHHVRVEGELVMEDDVQLGVQMEPLIPDDEPVFLLRGKDPAAFVAVQAWANEVERRDGDPALVARVREWAAEMAYYAGSHVDVTAPMKAPDVPEGLLR